MLAAPVRSPRLHLFVNSDDPRRYLARPATEHALAQLETRVRKDGAAATLLVGPPGIGKSMLLRVLVQSLRSTLRTVTLGAGDIDAMTLCAFVLDQLRVDPSDDPEHALLMLAADYGMKRSALVIALDSAEQLPLETAGRLGALAVTAGGSLRIVAAAQEPAAPLARALGCEDDVIALRAPMNLRETQAHLEAALAAGCAPPDVRELFHGLAAARIFRESHGIPSVVNAIAEEQLAAAVREGTVAEPGRAAWGRLGPKKQRPIVSI
jgi:type II secretory pathway predicted ATPase ExeA